MFTYLFFGGILEVIVLLTDPERMEKLEKKKEKVERAACGGRGGMMAGSLPCMPLI